MKFNKIIITLFFALVIVHGNSQENKKYESNYNQTSNLINRISVFTPYYTLTNFGKPETNTHHYEILARYQLTEKDQIGIKAATWKLFAPMGIQLWNPAFLDREAFYEGRLWERGIGITYQRMLWKGLFTTIETLPLITAYQDQEGKTIKKGFKLYTTFHLGYHIPLFKNKRFFLEPQIHANYWPINTNVPSDFKAKEASWNNYFLFEPNLYLGYKF